MAVSDTVSTTEPLDPATPASDPVSLSPAEPPSPVTKVRLRFSKDGALRWLSHHDLMRTMERTLRRSQLPMRTTQGFHPHPRMVFALSLPLGVIGREEVLELELNADLTPEEILGRLTGHCPPGLRLLSARIVPLRTTAQVRRLSYRLPVSPDRVADALTRIDALLASDQLWLERKRNPGREVNIRPFISHLSFEKGLLTMAFWMKPEGTARPDEMLELLGLSDLPAAGVVLERSRLELLDEPEEPVPVDVTR